MRMSVKQNKQKLSAAMVSVFVALALIGMQLIVGLATNSLAILADAAHSSLDLVGALITYFAVRLSNKPADSTHNYGHGKVEGLSAMAEVLLLTGFCIFIFYAAINRLISGASPVDANIYAFGTAIVSIALCGFRSLYLYRAAKKTGSQALEANALHFLSDMWSTVVVLIGLVAYRFFGLLYADSVAAIIVSVSVFLMTVKLAKRVANVLLDKAPSDTLEKITDLVKNTKGVNQLQNLRVRTSGNTIFTDMIITVEPLLSVEEAHKLSNSIEKKIKNKFPSSDITIHIEPERSKRKL
jgi:cation diffusion facilitator family transporter